MYILDKKNSEKHEKFVYFLKKINKTTIVFGVGKLYIPLVILHCKIAYKQFSFYYKVKLFKVFKKVSHERLVQ